jgi:hypothetical protein
MKTIQEHPILIGGLVVLLAAILVFLLMRSSVLAPITQENRIEFITATTTAWYALDGTVLRPAETPLGWKPHDGATRMLGTLSDGSSLAFSPAGLIHITHDGTETQLISDGPVGSSTPIAVSSADLTIIAFQNQVTRAIDVYHLDPVKLEATYAGTAKVPHADPEPVKLPDSFLSNLATTSEGQWTKTSVKTFDEELTRQTAKARFESESAAEPQAVAYKDGNLIIETVSGTFYSFLLSDGRIGEAAPLKVVATL